MSLEELRKDWESIKKPVNQNSISSDEIMAILKTKYRTSINKSLIFEIPLLFVYIYFIVLICFRYSELEIIYLEILGIVSIAMLTALFVLKILKLTTLYRNGYLNYAHTTVFKKLAKEKIRAQKLHLFHIVLGFILMVSLVILSIKIYNEYDMIQSKSFWLIIIPFSLIFIVLINGWIRKYYKKAVKEAEAWLMELD